MIPLKDDNPRLLFPFVTITLIVANIVAFYFEVTIGFEPIFAEFAAVPSDLIRFQNLKTVFTSMFLHGGYMHLAGNMLYLWIFGDNVEGSMGHGNFVVFYLACGILALAGHIAFGGADDVPLVGASGAISGVLSGYLVRYPKAQVLVLIPIVWFITLRRIPAIIVLGLWFAFQVLNGVMTWNAQGGGVAFWAHIGGFVAGLLLIYLFPNRRRRYA
jgi:membrane associated rhomboid family serine protease